MLEWKEKCVKISAGLTSDKFMTKNLHDTIEWIKMKNAHR